MAAETGVEYLLDALSSWEETSEMKTFELFEKALYKVVQKSDEAANSYALRLSTAFAELGDKVTLKMMQAFVLLRQSALTNEDKETGFDDGWWIYGSDADREVHEDAINQGAFQCRRTPEKDLSSQSCGAG